jgi:hypothetical protein
VITKILSFLRITDSKSQLSLTNIAVITLVTKVLTSPHPTAGDLVALAVVVANYIGKKIIDYHQSKIQAPDYNVQALSDSVKALELKVEDQKNKISSLSMATGMRSSKPGVFG